MIHQPLGGARGQATDVEIETREILRLKTIANEILVRHTGQPLERVEKDTDRNYYMSAEEAEAYGVVDQSCYRQPEIETRPDAPSSNEVIKPNVTASAMKRVS